MLLFYAIKDIRFAILMEAITGYYITAFLLGLFSTVHCISMCGSIIGALTLSLPVQIRRSRRRMLPYVFYYNLGRLLSYSLAGIIVGLFSFTLTTQTNGHIIIKYTSMIIMIAMGFYLAGWFPRFAKIEQVGAHIWKKLQPLGKKLIPVQTLSQACLLGMIWGWLPCGLVYAALAVAATSSQPIDASMVMLAFGAGTLPGVMSIGLFTEFLTSMARMKPLRRIAGISIIAISISTSLLPIYHNDNYDNHFHYEYNTL